LVSTIAQLCPIVPELCKVIVYVVPTLNVKLGPGEVIELAELPKPYVEELTSPEYIVIVVDPGVDEVEGEVEALSDGDGLLEGVPGL
jgi:hypothetical protein